jgi:hypothetical protein
VLDGSSGGNSGDRVGRKSAERKPCSDIRITRLLGHARYRGAPGIWSMEELGGVDPVVMPAGFALRNMRLGIRPLLEQRLSALMLGPGNDTAYPAKPTCGQVVSTSSTRSPPRVRNSYLSMITSTS